MLQRNHILLNNKFSRVLVLQHAEFLTSAAPYSLVFPSTPVNGSLLIAWMSFNGNRTITGPAGWTRLYNTYSATTTEVSALFYKVASSESSGTYTFTTSGGPDAAGFAYEISNYDPAGINWGTLVKQTFAYGVTYGSGQNLERGSFSMYGSRGVGGLYALLTDFTISDSLYTTYSPGSLIVYGHKVNGKYGDVSIGLSSTWLTNVRSGNIWLNVKANPFGPKT